MPPTHSAYATKIIGSKWLSAEILHLYISLEVPRELDVGSMWAISINSQFFLSYKRKE